MRPLLAVRDLSRDRLDRHLGHQLVGLDWGGGREDPKSGPRIFAVSAAHAVTIRTLGSDISRFYVARALIVGEHEESRSRSDRE